MLCVGGDVRIAADGGRAGLPELEPGGSRRSLFLEPFEDPIDGDSRLLGKICALELHNHERRVLAFLVRPCR